MRTAPLENWERDVLGMIREEIYYYLPQRQSKVMNDGWASYWHSKIMTEKAMEDSELISFADHHAGVVSANRGQLNPYKLGVELYRNIEERWNKGQFGKEWDECDDWELRRHWDRRTGLGREKIFEVRKHYNDITFIDEFLTLDFCREHKLFAFGYNTKRNRWEIESRKFEVIKRKLLDSITNLGQPFIAVEDANFENRAELLLGHRHEGADLDPGLVWQKASVWHLERSDGGRISRGRYVPPPVTDS